MGVTKVPGNGWHIQAGQFENSERNDEASVFGGRVAVSGISPVAGCARNRRFTPTADLFHSPGAKILRRLRTKENVGEDRQQQAMDREFLE